MAAPRPVLVVAVVALAAMLLPFLALLQAAPWRSVPRLLGEPVVTEALVISGQSAISATFISLILGVPLGWVLAHVEFRGRSLLRALVTLPMVLPPVVGGAALLLAFGRRGLFGGPVYDATGFLLPFSRWGVIVASTFVSLPFMILTVESGFRANGRAYEEAAATLGAKPWFIFRHVSLPNAAGSVAAGAVLCWARALGEFGATVTFAGNLQGRTQTLPLAVYLAMESDREAAIAISLVLIAVSLLVIIPLRDRWRVAG